MNQRGTSKKNPDNDKNNQEVQEHITYLFSELNTVYTLLTEKKSPRRAMEKWDRIREAILALTPNMHSNKDFCEKLAFCQIAEAKIVQHRNETINKLIGMYIQKMKELSFSIPDQDKNLLQQWREEFQYYGGHFSLDIMLRFLMKECEESGILEMKLEESQKSSSILKSGLFSSSGKLKSEKDRPDSPSVSSVVPSPKNKAGS